MPNNNRFVALLTAILVIVAGIVLVPPPASAATYTPPSLRQRVDLNTGWRFLKGDAAGAEATTFNDSAWQQLNVPHTWNAADGADGGNNYYRGVGWYRRHYAIPASFAGKMLFLQFAGANQVADVWVNGTHLGQHNGGYARFRFGATSALRVGQDNVIAVRVSNAHNSSVAPLSADYTFSGGIYRNVSLHVVDPLTVQMLDSAGPGVYLRQRSVTATSATVDVTTKLFNNNASSRSVVVRTVITDANGTVVADQSLPARTVGGSTGVNVTQTVTIANPRRWDGLTDPYLYKANVEILDVAANRVTDVVTEPLGLRTFAVDADTGFTLNGRELDLHGVNLHQDRAGAGWAVNDAQHTQDFDLVREIGATTVRLAHYQHDQKAYQLADERGLVVWAEIPLVDNITDSAAFRANTRQQLTELIRQNYNHPSIVFWGIGNEQRSDNATTNALLDQLAGLVDSEDPDRVSVYASCCVSDTGAVNSHAEASAYNKYYGWYQGSYNDLGGYLDSLHAANPTRTIALSEYGAGASTTQHALNPGRPNAGGPNHPEEYQALLHEASWKQLDAREYIWGSYVWNMFDFASDARNEGGQPGINDKGLVTRDRLTRKDAFHFYKASWSASPTLYITSRRWTQRSTAATELKVYSNASSVSATLNGTSLGSRSSTDHIFKWTGVTLRPGANTVQVTATIDGATVIDTVTWTLG
ncbi:glycoside hydrolase family 2 protein [Micromonospora sp. LH3U1]|uniref:glycoside hydrolase family 2 protein n=1 Tax=Micromonospora sp. LH3U1 TaxID=3018339 RepID=UPI00234B239F|nr:glycoside hydrolase family 2 TIM barrel-domain containing protein [Micromonospora sp. LH3U1]WCN79573.1 glycoside hydrolase family 2 TIM barrel-domain containing protein [Micromonospora sp. LH3U1]